MNARLITRNQTEADKEWTRSAFNNRHDIEIYEFSPMGSNITSKVIKGGSTFIKSMEYDHGYKNYLMKACNHLKTDYPDEKDLSFRRDYYLIRDVDSMYITGYFDVKSNIRSTIKGRDSWIVEMFIDKLLNNKKKGMIPLYLYSENMNCWCQFNTHASKWMYITRPPRPNGKYLAIGTDPMSSGAKLEVSLI